MGALLESGMVGNIGLKHLRVIKEDTIKKWDDLGFLEGLNGHQKDNIAQLYENQASYLINEAATADASGSFETVVFPIIRRVFSKLLANDIVSVQAMNLPIGKLFFFVPKIQERNASNGHYSPYGIPGGAGGSSASTGYTGINLYDRFYENSDANDQGLFDYSKGEFSTVSLTGTSLHEFAAGEAGNGVTYTSGSTVTSLGSVILKLTGFSKPGQGKLAGPDGNEMDTEEFLASLSLTCPRIAGLSGRTSLPFNVVTQKYGKGIVEYGSRTAGANGLKFNDICDEDGAIYLNVDLQSYSSTAGYSNFSVTGTTSLDGTDFTAEYRRYATLEFEDAIGEVSFDLESVTVSVTERKLRASWSPELAQDVSAFHNIDAEAELTALLSEQIAAEVDREILRDLRKGAAWKAKWDYNEWKYGGTGGATLQGYTQKDWNQTLVTKVNQISAQIHKTTLRGGANWIVVSSEVSAVFDDLEYFHVSNAAPEQDSYNMGIEKIGSLAGRYQVYRDPYFPAGKILIGHKGKSLLDAGYVYAPYVPLQLTPTMYNPFNMTPIKGIMTRYAKKMVNNRYFGVIDVQGIVTFNMDTLR
jgi:hypothetical protein